MRILVTGATGFVGRAFCKEAVKRGHDLIALTRSPEAIIEPSVEIAVGSLSEVPWGQISHFAPEAVLHLAWVAEPGVYLHSPTNEIWFHESKVFLDKLIESGVSYVSGAGTCIEYAASDEPLDEDTSPLAPTFPYSKAKVALYEWLREKGHHESLSWSWCRIFYPYGPGENSQRICTSLINQIKLGKSLSLKTPKSVKDYIFIDDLAHAICLIIEQKFTGPINIGTGDGVAICDLASKLVRLLQADPALIQHASVLLPDPTPFVVANNQLLKNFGWNQKIDLAEGLRRTINSITDATQ